MAYNQLNDTQKAIILDKGTEKSFSGDYWNHYEDGTYTCAQCNAPLFNSDTKFDSFTGWPSFDATVEGAVKEVPDADGRRIEVVCSNCGGHLGHVFKGEGITETSTRHCINSASLSFTEKS
ncbi:MAG: Peptide-methionine (R)-S-oxide reductase [uncultured Sulfurovum sp.]|uniref:peptide-methionine (R)-S-oxide reductase n=1 Tax=uncultured Sulfurovum sp. TaxID=269237 RepID=A0A6S6ST89_9BACT|nr:MAG: Peptide-methionine (R)-S-oxide reductase [uncultured Sulfurovum sp.]